MIITVREGAERIDIPLRFRSPFALTAAPTSDNGLDMVAVERSLGGEMPRPKLQIDEAFLAWQLITSPQGEAPDRPVAELLGITDRTVCRWRNGQTRTDQARIDNTPGGGDMKDRWEDRALCRQLQSDDFFPAGDVGTAARSVYREAIKVCARCPVAGACLQFALRAEGSAPAKSRSGVFGGLTPAERHELHRRQVEQAEDAALLLAAFGLDQPAP
ncbi:WhiB family transcriptional regulator [Kitasatospora sp. NPDC057692]|uniref:WhiB family transcriptional regulator n=1 Tax=Kitasatospora sp. NPDC057692 TaxID=3346215 RepID=UPI0036C155CB